MKKRFSTFYIANKPFGDIVKHLWRGGEGRGIHIQCMMVKFNPQRQGAGFIGGGETDAYSEWLNLNLKPEKIFILYVHNSPCFPGKSLHKTLHRHF